MWLIPQHSIRIKGEGMKTYVFRVVIEPDEDRWSAHCPALHTYGAATWGVPRRKHSSISRKSSRWLLKNCSKMVSPFPKTCRSLKSSCLPSRSEPWRLTKLGAMLSLPYATTSHHNTYRGLTGENLSLSG